MIQELKKEFHKYKDLSHFYFKQLDLVHIKGKDWYIYKVAHSLDALEKYGWYEVFQHKTVNKMEYKEGKFIKLDDMKVKYPSDEDFGKWAFTFPYKYTIEDIIKCISKRI